MSPGRAVATVLVSAATVGAGCGGEIDRDDPRSVAKGYVASYYDCGDEGAGLRYELQVERPGDPSHDVRLARERASGCRPARVPKLDALLIGMQGDLALVRITNPDDCTRDPSDHALPLVRTPDGWKVTTRADGATPHVCVRHGSRG